MQHRRVFAIRSKSAQPVIFPPLPKENVSVGAWLGFRLLGEPPDQDGDEDKGEERFPELPHGNGGLASPVGVPSELPLHIGVIIKLLFLGVPRGQVDPGIVGVIGPAGAFIGTAFGAGLGLPRNLRTTVRAEKYFIGTGHRQGIVSNDPGLARSLGGLWPRIRRVKAPRTIHGGIAGWVKSVYGCIEPWSTGNGRDSRDCQRDCKSSNPLDLPELL